MTLLCLLSAAKVGKLKDKEFFTTMYSENINFLKKERKIYLNATTEPESQAKNEKFTEISTTNKNYYRKEKYSERLYL